MTTWENTEYTFLFYVRKISTELLNNFLKILWVFHIARSDRGSSKILVSSISLYYMSVYKTEFKISLTVECKSFHWMNSVSVQLRHSCLPQFPLWAESSFSASVRCALSAWDRFSGFLFTLLCSLSTRKLPALYSPLYPSDLHTVSETLLELTKSSLNWSLSRKWMTIVKKIFFSLLHSYYFVMNTTEFNKLTFRHSSFSFKKEF